MTFCRRAVGHVSGLKQLKTNGIQQSRDSFYEISGLKCNPALTLAPKTEKRDDLAVFIAWFVDQEVANHTVDGKPGNVKEPDQFVRPEPVQIVPAFVGL